MTGSLHSGSSGDKEKKAYQDSHGLHTVDGTASPLSREDNEPVYTHEELQITEPERKSLLRRLDIKIIPYVTLLYLLSFLDRVNIGQASVAGMRADLNMLNGNSYAIALSVFFVSYVAVEIPALVLLKRFGLRRSIPAMMVAWSTVMVLMGIVHNAAGLTAARFFLGLAEGPLFPVLNYGLTCWYSRKQLGSRVAIFFSGATLAGAFGGILAYGLDFIPMPAGPFEGESWRWIFIIEGLLTILCAIPAYWLIVDFPQKEKRTFTPLEMAQWKHQLSLSQGVTNSDIGFNWKEIRDAYTDWKTYCYAAMYIGVACTLYSLALFTPTIIAALGTFDRSQSNLLSVPPYVLGFITTMISARLSDKYLMRSPFIVFWMLWVVVGYTIQITDVSAGVKYFAIHLCVAGVSPCIALSITFIGNNIGPVYRRGAAMGFFFCVGNSGGLISSNVYPRNEGPRYIKGHAINLAMAGVAITCATILGVHNWRANAARDKIAYANPDGTSADPLKADDPEEKAKWGIAHLSKAEVLALGDRHPAFRYVL